ncbi:hypothetical protein [Clostridium ljungdahlii]|uniref:Uncharacterized protein n=1 Tax=Clostridium ljungdahlii (strain ATCC 55383 / DSM 13528 / PETC) TaxID=748727 RepID=D8GQ67_CLOLD|nr:hypothetical protein [Clostridium ljungdahlii]ADK16158.1 hypothetical protein CLJU_c31100 [Clostridium ljungdahlii DSM 13528]OAA89974.1 hypothetical protein WX45_01813 [Clostridium ljungdahlii DSM 13528]
MAGTVKPNIVGLGKEVTPTIIGTYGIATATGLFDGAQPDSWVSNGVCYWGSVDYYIELLIPKKCNIWRSGINSFSNMCAPFSIIKKNDSGGYDDVTSLYSQTLTQIGNTQWEKTIINLLPGQYRFVSTGKRIDSEWYLEEVNTNKFLIKQGTQYYSIKNNVLTLLGLPTDDTQKEKWFNDNGVDDLKTALLTPQSDGSKLIDKLDEKFEIRMMKPKD